MSQEHDIMSIFCNAIEKETAEERKAYLDEACGNDAELRAKVEELLKLHEKAGDFLEAPAFGSDVTLESHPFIEGPGTTIGRYKLLQLIGEGGMGLVYLAEQTEPVKRQVALKIVKPGMDSKQVIARFEAERQVLALLDHPNIAHVFDAGTTQTGRPYFAMEYVKGLSITDYCDQHKLSIEDRLKLFLQICYAVQYAHQKGIIHRDIKPSNILVTVQGDMPIPKIIDFGIAKALTHTFTEGTLFTQQGQLLGTPEYMSPEQVDMATQDIDTRSDIYSLGVLLYVLLSGALPFDRQSLEKGGFAALQKSILEEEPLNPSIRLTGLGEEAKEIANRRKTQVVALAKRLHRELEWIPLKAMRKERIRRYRSVSELADDIQNYLNGNPLIAGPETATYRVKKFVRRHAGSVATVILIVAAIVLGLVISSAMYYRSEKALQREAIARIQADQARESESIARKQAEHAQQAEQEQRKVAEQKAEDLRWSMYVNNIQLADAKYKEGNITRVRELLDSCPNDLRGWEWNRLNYISDQSIMTLRGHQDIVYSVALSLDGKRIISGSWDKTIKVWNTSTGNELMTLRGIESMVNSVAVSADGKLIASGSDDGAIKVWDASTGNELMTLHEHENEVTCVAFSPDGKRIVSCSDLSPTIKVWDLTTGTQVITLRGHENGVNSIAFSPDGSRMASVGEGGTIKVWDTSNWAEQMVLRGQICVTFSPDGKRIASGYGGIIKVWDASTGDELAILRGHNYIILSLAFSPDGKHIVSGSHDNMIKVWDIAAEEEIMTLHGHTYPVTSVAFTPNGKQIVSGSWDKTIKVWDVTIDSQVTELIGHVGLVYTIAFSPDNKRIAAGHSDGIIQVWDTKTGAEVITFRGHRGLVSGVAFSPDCTHIVSAGCEDRRIKIWDAITGEELKSLYGHEGRITSVAFSPDGRRIVSGSDGSNTSHNTIKVWDANTGAEVMTLKGHYNRVRSLAFSPDGKHIVSGGEDKTLGVWDAKTGKELMTLCGDTFRGVRGIAVSPDGKRIASAGEDVKVFDAATGAELMTFRGHRHMVDCVAFSPDSRRIISSSRDGTAKVWDVTTGAELMTLPGGYFSAAFSPNGKVAAASAGGILLLWESESPEGGYESRKNGAVARKLVDELYQKYGFYYDVIDKLRADKALDEPVCKIALQIANSRKWEDAEKLKEQNWEVVKLSDKDADAYKSALENVVKANSLEPNDPSILNTLGVAQYRVGMYEDALKTLTKTDKIRTDANEPHPEDVAFIAMTLRKLGRTEEAKAALDRLRNLLKGERFAQDEEAKVFLAEAENLIEGEKK